MLPFGKSNLPLQIIQNITRDGMIINKTSFHLIFFMISKNITRRKGKRNSPMNKNNWEKQSNPLANITAGSILFTTPVAPNMEIAGRCAALQVQYQLNAGMQIARGIHKLNPKTKFFLANSQIL